MKQPTFVVSERHHKFLSSWPLTWSLFGKMSSYVGFKSKRQEKWARKPVRLGSTGFGVVGRRHCSAFDYVTKSGSHSDYLRKSENHYAGLLVKSADCIGYHRPVAHSKTAWWGQRWGLNESRGRREASPWRCRARGGDGDKIKLSMPLRVDISITNSSPCHPETKASPQGDVIRRAMRVHLKLPPQIFQHTALACNGKLGVGTPTQSPPSAPTHSLRPPTPPPLSPLLFCQHAPREKALKRGSRTWTSLFLSLSLNSTLLTDASQKQHLCVNAVPCVRPDAWCFFSEWTMQSGSASLICHGDLVCRRIALCFCLFWWPCFVCNHITAQLRLRLGLAPPLKSSHMSSSLITASRRFHNSIGFLILVYMDVYGRLPLRRHHYTVNVKVESKQPIFLGRSNSKGEIE